ncbi:MAG: hypothetical protein RMK89_10495, partial [Armatimonadota bacterium]|nr:hypothetical protein [Armatimonadota bacterium]MDW8143878.1 hypothetical protein [Armatimonadota bacterium]
LPANFGQVSPALLFVSGYGLKPIAWSEGEQRADFNQISGRTVARPSECLQSFWSVRLVKSEGGER